MYFDPEKTGLGWRGNYITLTKPCSQAEKAGILGWRIVSINQQMMQDDTEFVGRALKKAKQEDKKIEIIFSKKEEKTLKKQMFGYLEKRGTTNTAWKSRYWVLEGNSMIYSLNPSRDTIKGKIDLAEFKITTIGTEKEFQIENAERTYYLRADTRGHRDKWTNALIQVQERMGIPKSPLPRPRKSTPTSIVGTSTVSSNERITPDLLGIQMFGFLEKRGRTNTGWKRRYWVLKGNYLLYFMDDSRFTEKGKIELAKFGFRIKTAGTENEFQIETVERTYCLRAETRAERDTWINVLNALHEGNNQVIWRVVSNEDLMIRSQPVMEANELGFLRPGDSISGLQRGNWIKHHKGWTMMLSDDGVTLLRPMGIKEECLAKRAQSKRIKKKLPALMEKLVLDYVLKDPLGQTFFADHLKTEFCAENLYFYQAVQNFKSIESSTLRDQAARDIISQYVEVGSPDEVNIDSIHRNVLLNLVRDGDISLILFDETQKEVHTLMVHPFERFKQSKFGEHYVSERLKTNSNKLANTIEDPGTLALASALTTMDLNLLDTNGPLQIKEKGWWTEYFRFFEICDNLLVYRDAEHVRKGSIRLCNAIIMDNADSTTKFILKTDTDETYTLEAADKKEKKKWIKALKMSEIKASLENQCSCNFNNRNITIEDIVLISHFLYTNSTLTILDLSSNKLGNPGGRALANALKINGSITLLNLKRNLMGDIAAKALGDGLNSNSAVTELDLSENNIGDGITAIGDALKVNQTLKKLNMFKNKISDSGANAIADAVNQNTTFETLIINGEIPIKSFRNATQKHIILTSVGYCIPDIIILGLLIRDNNTVTKLDLSDNNINSAGAIALSSGLKINTFLSELRLSINCISDKGAKAIAQALKNNTSLSTLDVCQNKIHDVGAIAFGEFLKSNSSLKKLFLNYNQIGDGGTRAIVEGLKHNKTLHMLFLDGNKIGNEGGQLLAEGLKLNKTLRSIWLFNNIFDKTVKIKLKDTRNKHSSITDFLL